MVRKWSKNRSTPLQLTWTRNSVKILGIYFSHAIKISAIKIQKLQTNLNLTTSRNLTLFGKVLIIKSLGLSQLFFSASNLNVPIEFTNDTRNKLFRFLWKNKNNKVEENVFITIMEREEFVCLTLISYYVWRGCRDFLIQQSKTQNHQYLTILFTKVEASTFVKMQLRPKVPGPKTSYFFFLQRYTVFLRLINSQHKQENEQEWILFNNKESLIDAKPFFIKEWFAKGIVL